MPVARCDAFVVRLSAAGAVAALLATLRPVPLAAAPPLVAAAAARAPQGDADRRGAAPLVSAAAVARHLVALAADSAAADSGRLAAPPADSAAPRLERGARYVAERFAALGLQPLVGASGITGPYAQEYPAPGGRTLEYDNIAVTIATFLRHRGTDVLTEDGFEAVRPLQLPLATAAPLVRGVVAEGHNGRFLGGGFFGPTQRPVPVVVAGPHTPALAAKVAVRGKVVFYVPAAGLDSLTERAIVDTLARASAGSRGVVVVTAEDSARFAARARAVRRSVPLVDDYLRAARAGPAWTVYVRAADSLAHVFALAGLDLAELQRAPAPLAREPLPLSAAFWVPSLSPLGRPQLANIVGVLEGSDSALKGQYVVVAAHLPTSDSVADNHDLSGAAGVLALAETLSHSAPRPRRSVLFAVTSGAGRDAAGGAEREFGGAEYLAAKLLEQRVHVVAALTLGRLAGRADSVALDGLREVDVGIPADWVTARADSGLAVELGSVFTAPCAAHCAFLRRKVPSLYLHAPGATHDTVPAGAASGATAAADPERTARAVRLTLYLAQAIANADRAPRWRAGVREQLDRSDGQ